MEAGRRRDRVGWEREGAGCVGEGASVTERQKAAGCCHTRMSHGHTHRSHSGSDCEFLSSHNTSRVDQCVMKHYLAQSAILNH